MDIIYSAIIIIVCFTVGYFMGLLTNKKSQKEIKEEKLAELYQSSIGLSDHEKHIYNSALQDIKNNIQYLKSEYQKYQKPKTPEELQKEHEFAEEIKKMKEILDIKVKEQLNGKK